MGKQFITVEENDILNTVAMSLMMSWDDEVNGIYQPCGCKCQPLILLNNVVYHKGVRLQVYIWK